MILGNEGFYTGKTYKDDGRTHICSVESPFDEEVKKYSTGESAEREMERLSRVEDNLRVVDLDKLVAYMKSKRSSGGQKKIRNIMSCQLLRLLKNGV